MNPEPPAPIFVPGQAPANPGPLARYLPPLPEGLTTSWIKDPLPPGSWLLDPFGASPQLALELARAGYRVLVAGNNPVTGFMLETLASAPHTSDLQVALAELGSSRKGSERLEPFIQDGYAVVCPHCGETIQARAFIWRKDAKEADSCLLDCPNCSESGEHPVQVPSSGHPASLPHADLARARAHERVAAQDDPIRPNVDLALTCYLDRPLIKLFTLINRAEGLNITPERLRLVQALLLSACDEASALWPHPVARQRPRQLGLPPIFRENNLWLALEKAVKDWATAGAVAGAVDSLPVPFTRWPTHPAMDGGGICLFPGPVRDLASALPDLSIQAVITVFPRPNQAFWTLSALWAGWLWGRESLTSFKSALARQRYDWSWYSTAVHAALSVLQPQLPANTPFYGLVTEVESTYLAAIAVAAQAAGLTWQGMAYRPGQDLAQLQWRNGPGPSRPAPAGKPIGIIAGAAIESHLLSRGEPASYIVLHAAAIAGLAQDNALVLDSTQPVSTDLETIQASLHRVFTDHNVLVRYGAKSETPESGLWWLRETTPTPPTLADRVEMEVVRFLQHQPGSSTAQVDAAICASFPGLLTPPSTLILACLESYAVQSSSGADEWELRPEEAPAARRADLKEIQTILVKVGEKLCSRVQLPERMDPTLPLLWLNGHGQVDYAFYLLASVTISRSVWSTPYPPPRCLFVIPGSRANLLAYKLPHDPLLNEAIAGGWRFLKFRLVRHMAIEPPNNLEAFAGQLAADPLEFKPTQIELF
jgi:hypothetical protein